MRHGSLFSGIGGFDLAAEWMGWENVFHCEINEFCQKVLKYYWPEAILYEDITKTDFKKWKGLIDILTGGFPCQPFSRAGKRKGTDDYRNLWPEMLRSITEIWPSWVVGENVPGIIDWANGMVFQQVQNDLEAEGYEVFPPIILPACGKDSPHQRDRVWFVAHSNGKHINLSTQQRGQTKANKFNAGQYAENGVITNADSKGLQKWIQSGWHEVIRKNEAQAGSKSSRIPAKGYWEQFPTQSPVFVRNDGLSSRLDGITVSKWRKESISGAGNAISPQVVYEIFKAIERMNSDPTVQECDARKLSRDKKLGTKSL